MKCFRLFVLLITGPALVLVLTKSKFGVGGGRGLCVEIEDDPRLAGILKMIKIIKEESCG